MRTIKFGNRFKKDFRREERGRYARLVEAELRVVLDMLIVDDELPIKFRDHALAGEWIDHRDCHIRPDLVLIYRKPDDVSLELVRLGSHSELGL